MATGNGKREKYRGTGDSCACYNLRRATRLVTQLYDEALRPAGIRGTQFTLLAATAAMGSAPVQRLAEAIVMDRTTLTRNLAPLERDGLVSIRSGDDHRVREVSLTAKGRRILERAYPLWERVQAVLRDRVGDVRVEQLVSDLQATVRELQASEA